MPAITTLLIQPKTTPVDLNLRHGLLKWNAPTRTVVSDGKKHIKMNFVYFIKSSLKLTSSYCVNCFNFNVSISLGICILFVHLCVWIWSWISVFCTYSMSWFGLAHVATCCQRRLLTLATWAFGLICSQRGQLVAGNIPTSPGASVTLVTCSSATLLDV